MDITGRKLLAGGSGGEIGILTILNNMSNDEVAIIWIIVGLLILINFLWELFTDTLEYIFWKKNRYIIAMMEKLYKELTIVGIWSVFLFVLGSTFGVSNDTLHHIFELIHISLFGLVLIYVGTMVFIACLSLLIFRFWHWLEHCSESQIRADYKRVKEYQERTNFCLYYINIFGLLKKKWVTTKFNYYIYRTYFIQQLQLDDSFHFDAYLKRAMKGTFEKFAHIHWSILGWVLVFQLAIWMAFVTFLPEHRGIPYTVLGALCFAAFIILRLKISIAYHELKNNPTIWSLPKKYSTNDSSEKPEEGTFEIEMNPAEGLVSRSTDFHVRMGDDSSESDSATDSNHKKRSVPSKKHHSASHPNILPPEDSDNDTTDSSSWVSTWSSSWVSSWASGSEGENLNGDQANDIEHERHRHHHHHHHHHTHHHHAKMRHTDVYFIAKVLIPLLTCRTSWREAKEWLMSATPHQELFWFGKPGFFGYMVQLWMFWQALILFLILGGLLQVIEMSYAYQPFVIGSCLINVFYLVPSILYDYSFCLNVGEYSKEEYIREIGTDRKVHKTKHPQKPELSENSSDSTSSENSVNQSSSSPRSMNLRHSSQLEPPQTPPLSKRPVPFPQNLNDSSDSSTDNEVSQSDSGY